jgi:alpha-L-fucosidase
MAEVDGTWQQVAASTTIGYKKILKLDKPVNTAKVRVQISSAKASPLVSNVEIY